jgi:hypothetical protein
MNNPGSNSSFSELVLFHLAMALREIEVLQDPEEMSQFLTAIGATQQPTSQQISDLITTVNDVFELFQQSPTPTYYVDLLRTIKELINAIEALDLTPPENLVRGALGYFLLRYLHRNLPSLEAGLSFLGVLEPEPTQDENLTDEGNGIEGTPGSTPAVESPTFDPSRLIQIFQNPGQWAKAVYGWESEDFNVETLLRRSNRLAQSLGYGIGKYAISTKLQVWLGSASAMQWRIPIYRIGEIGCDYGEFGLVISAGPTGGNGVLASIYAVGTLNETLYEGDLVQVSLESTLDLTSGLGILIEPGCTPVIVLGPGTGVAGQDIGSFLITVSQTTPTEMILLGNVGGPRLGIRSLSAKAGLEGDPTQPELIIELGIEKAFFSFKPDEGDGFLGKVLPLDLEIEFQLRIGWSSVRNFYFGGSGGLEVTLPLHVKLGPVSVETVRLLAKLINEDNKTSIGFGSTASLGIVLGPVAVTLQDIGLQGDIAFDEKSRPVFSGLKFLPPTGAGLVVDAEGITGGGNLLYDDANKQYVGTLQLKFGEMGLQAIGLITTRMPDGSPGYSMLLIISVEFSPAIQLSFGFTLSAVGGLIGINRTMDLEVLKSGLKNGTANAILFPENPIQNASTIISNLTNVFPLKDGRFIIGPMVRISWGTPAILNIEAAVIIELPSPVRVVILGQLSAFFPTQDYALVEVHLEILGIIDFGRKTLSIDATLIKSRILQYPLTGDAALRLTWGDSPEFAMSLGGFHPKFSPPPDFPTLQRLTLAIGSGDNFQLTCQAYQALTANSLQFGVRADLYVGTDNASLRGDLSFDTLIYFSPFSFEIEIDASLTIKVRGVKLAGVDVHMMLSGPAPWHAEGRVKIEILFFDITVHFSLSWGQSGSAMIDSVDPWTSFQAVLNRSESWRGLLLEGVTMVDALRPIKSTSAAGANDLTLVHPAGALEIRQNVLPLGIRLEKFGNAPIKDHVQFDIGVPPLATEDNPDTISSQGSQGNSLLALSFRSLDEFFARSQFEDLTDDQKLSFPSFEKMTGGVKGDGLLVRIDGNIIPRPVNYQSVLIGSDETSHRPRFHGVVASEIFGKHIAGCAASMGGPGATGNRKFLVPGRIPKVGVVEESYVVVRRDDLGEIEGLPSAQNPVTRFAADQAMKAYQQQHPELAGCLQVMQASEVE